VEQRPSPKRSAASPKGPAKEGAVGGCSLCSLRRQECDIHRKQVSALEEQGGDPAQEDEWAQGKAERREAEWEKEKEGIQADRARA